MKSSHLFDSFPPPQTEKAIVNMIMFYNSLQFQQVVTKKKKLIHRVPTNLEGGKKLINELHFNFDRSGRRNYTAITVWIRS